jgi:hypothetical protein
MVRNRYAAQIGTDQKSVRGSMTYFYPVRSDATDTLVSGAAPRTNCRDGHLLGVGSGEHSLSRNAVRWKRGTRLQLSSWLTNETNEKQSQKSAFSASGNALSQPWPTQGVDSKAQVQAQRSDAMGFGKAAGSANRDQGRDLADPPF